MAERSVTHSTFVIERTYPAAPERVYAAFSDPAKKRKWFAEGEESEIEHYALDFREGGREETRFSARNGWKFTNQQPLGMRHAFDADHIAAIDNTTRKLMNDGQRPLAVGFFFSLGHSTVVFGLAVLLASGVRTIVGTSGTTLRGCITTRA